MKSALVPAMFIFLAFFGVLGAQTIVCDGQSCGGSGVVSYDGQFRDYVYRVTGGAVPPALDTVFIGTHDPNLNHYSAICMPSGWAYEIIPMTRPDYSNPINHSVVSPAPDGNCPYMFLFRNVSGTPLSSSIPTDFGFDYYGYSHTVDWMVAAIPPVSANWTSGVGTGAGPVHGPRCDTLCEIGYHRPLYSLAGRKDNFSTVDGSEPSSPTVPLLNYMMTISAGADPNFDSPQNNRCFGHSFTGFDVLGCVVGAELCFRITAITEGNNDFINIREDATTPVWGPQIKFLKAWKTGNPADTFWTVGDTLEVCLDLANLPLIKRGTTYYWPPNILATLQDGDMDFLMSDDTKIDYLELRLTVCSDTCWATGDVDGDGLSLTTGDLAALIAFVNNRVLPNGPLWQCDLNGDDHIDQLDIDIFQCFLAQGMSCFPVYPVPTDCDPDTVRGACCHADSCGLLSEENCTLLGGTYYGDGIDCSQSQCVPQPGACCWPDGSCTQVTNASDQCTALGGKWMGFGVPCSPNPCGGCIKPPSGLLAWWPFDDGVSTIGKDIAGAHHGTIPCGDPATVPEPAGMVGGGARFSHDLPNLAPLRIWDDPFDEIGRGDFTIDAWIYPEVLPAFCQTCETNLHCEYRIILDNHMNNRNTYADHDWHDNGLAFFVKNPTPPSAPYPGAPGQLGLAMNTTTFLSSTAPVVLNQWQHVAVTISRASGAPVGTFYYNGVALGPNPFTPIAGTVYWTGLPGWPCMDIGHATPLNGGSCGNCNDYFNGVLDEVQIFNRALAPSEILGLYAAGSHGKCRTRCHVPRKLAMCPNETSTQFKLTIFDESGGPGPVTYNWGIASSPYPNCPSGVTDNYTAAFTFQATSPSQVSVMPGVPFPITITATPPVTPPFAPGSVSCFSVWIQNAASPQDMVFCRGSIRRVDVYYCPVTPPVFDLPVPIEINNPVEVAFVVHNTGDPSGQFNYRMNVLSSCACDSPANDSLISLNDQPPGFPVTGTVAIPQGDSAEVRVTARLTRFAAFSMPEIVLSADWDNEGTMTEGPSISLRPLTYADCNKNGQDDLTDISLGISSDTNGNAVPDECEYAPNEVCYACGDANADTAINIGDAIFIINYVFKGGDEPVPMTAGDANGDCIVNVGDAVAIINYIFKGGDYPVCNPECIWENR